MTPQPYSRVRIRRNGTSVSKGQLHTHAHGSIIRNSQDLEIAQVSVNTWTDKGDVTHTHAHEGMLLNREREGNPAMCNSTGGPWRHCAKGGKSGRERQALCAITYIRNLKTLNLHRESGMLMMRGWGGGWEDAVSGCKLTTSKWLLDISCTAQWL